MTAYLTENLRGRRRRDVLQVRGVSEGMGGGEEEEGHATGERGIRRHGGGEEEEGRAAGERGIREFGGWER